MQEESRPRATATPHHYNDADRGPAERRTPTATGCASAAAGWVNGEGDTADATLSEMSTSGDSRSARGVGGAGFAFNGGTVRRGRQLHEYSGTILGSSAATAAGSIGSRSSR